MSEKLYRVYHSTQKIAAEKMVEDCGECIGIGELEIWWVIDGTLEGYVKYLETGIEKGLLVDDFVFTRNPFLLFFKTPPNKLVPLSQMLLDMDKIRDAIDTDPARWSEEGLARNIGSKNHPEWMFTTDETLWSVIKKAGVKK